MKNCKSCNKYVVSCPILEGFECCKCCGIGECEYDICPSEEKLSIELTRHELYYAGEISWGLGAINNSKDALLLGKFNNYYYRSYKASEHDLIKMKENIVKDKEIRIHIKKRFIKEINEAISGCKDLRKMLLKSGKGGTFNYFKRNIMKISIDTIENTRKLSRVEKIKLIKVKGERYEKV